MSHEAKGEEEMKLVMMIMFFFFFFCKKSIFFIHKIYNIHIYLYFFLLLGTFEYKSIFEQLNRFFF